MKRTESCARRRGGGEKEMGDGVGGSFLKGIMNSLSTLLRSVFETAYAKKIGNTIIQ